MRKYTIQLNYNASIIVEATGNDEGEALDNRCGGVGLATSPLVFCKETRKFYMYNKNNSRSIWLFPSFSVTLQPET